MEKANAFAINVLQRINPALSPPRAFDIGLIIEIIELILENCDLGLQEIVAAGKSPQGWHVWMLRRAARRAGVRFRDRNLYVQAILEEAKEGNEADLLEGLKEVRVRALAA